ncbi:MAG: hypothetical protein HQK54_06700 [Oligoflexales bacterium]|nr:hypothetical protein [Oligoflexales bacterium]
MKRGLAWNKPEIDLLKERQGFKNIHLEQFMKQKNKNQKKNRNRRYQILTDVTQHNGYLSALRGYWEGRPRTAIERLGDALAHTPSETDAYKLYRLWIEILVEQGEIPALKSLYEHLGFRAELDPELSPTHAALRGLIHFEMDEIEAVDLILVSLKKEKANPYILELRQLVDSRFHLKNPPIYLQKVQDQIGDYFHFQTLARGYLMRNKQKDLIELLNEIKNQFPYSPLPDIFQLHKLMEQGEWRSCKNIAANLSSRFPGNREYGFQLGFISAKLGEYDDALRELNRINNLHEEPDPDVLNWMGFCLTEKAIKEKSNYYKDEARRVLTSAIEISRECGIPVSFPMEQLGRLNNVFGDQQTGNDKGRAWLVKLSPQKFHEIKTARESQIRKIKKAIGDVPRIGDICFLVGEDYVNQQDNTETKWRLAAVYKVISDPIWHPLLKHVNILMLVNRPEYSIPLDVREFGASMQNKQKKPIKMDVYELDANAIRIIDETILEYSENDKSISATTSV